MYEIKIESFGLQDLLRPDIIANPYPVFRRDRKSTRLNSSHI